MSIFSRRSGFTLIELAVVSAILGVFGFAFARYTHHVRNINAALCASQRSLIERSEDEYALAVGRPSASLYDLVDAGILSQVPACPARGVYAWQTADHRAVICSVHSVQQKELTSLGSTFTDITQGMIALISAFYDKNGRYPRSFGTYVYTDIGLTPEEWAVSYGGLFYQPGGSRVAIRPDTGYAVTVTGADGKTRNLTPSLKWSLWYDMQTGAWYYHTIEPGQAVDISTLVVKKW